MKNHHHRPVSSPPPPTALAILTRITQFFTSPEGTGWEKNLLLLFFSEALLTGANESSFSIQLSTSGPRVPRCSSSHPSVGGALLLRLSSYSTSHSSMPTKVGLLFSFKKKNKKTHTSVCLFISLHCFFLFFIFWVKFGKIRSRSLRSAHTPPTIVSVATFNSFE